MTPIEKNIAVTDESGKQYEPTYWKRAKGLVKHGRARWVDEEKICLTCPPEQIEAEDITMDEKVANNIKDQIAFLKADLDSLKITMEPGVGQGMVQTILKYREDTRQKILQLMSKLAGIEPEQADPTEKQYYRQMLERIANDRAALQTAKEAAEEMDDDEGRLEVIRNAVDEYETTKREIAEKILAKLG
jgi:hypothetical protein